MRAMILNGIPVGGDNNLYTTIQDILKNNMSRNDWDITSFQLSQLDIKSCLGCFSCWIKTPGKCVINDDAEKVIRAYVKSDVVILLTPIVYGGFSHELKKAMDRIIPILLPFFSKVNKETHHQHRYPAKSNWVVIGTLPEPDQKLEIDSAKKCKYYS